MISLGGAIGTSLFLLERHRPWLCRSLGYGQLRHRRSVAVALVFSLSEMAVMHPAAGSLGTYAETYLNPLAGFVVRYTYWFAQVIATGFEAVAAGIYMTYWFPGTPVWLWAMGFTLVVITVNSRSVGELRNGRILVRLHQGDGYRAVHHLGDGPDLRTGCKARSACTISINYQADSFPTGSAACGWR